MILVADSGSTKTAWGLIEGSHHRIVHTEGLNPKLAGDEAFGHAIGQLGITRCEQVRFYGAGCGSPQAQEQVRGLLRRYLDCADIVVEGDLMGACRATLGCRSGLVGILGTGSNACRYDGGHIVQQVTSTGYLLGDEGSGNHIGKRLLKEYLVRRMPQRLCEEFRRQFPLSDNEWIVKLYGAPYPNRFLATLVPFAARHRDDPFVRQLLAEVFDQYFREMILPLNPNDSETLCLVGGVAYEFQTEIAQAASLHSVSVATITSSIIEALIANANSAK